MAEQVGSPLPQEALRRLLEEEKKAQELLHRADERAQKIVADAQAEAQRLLQDAHTQAQKEAEALIAQARRQAEQQAKARQDALAKELEELARRAEGNIPAAVKALVDWVTGREA